MSFQGENVHIPTHVGRRWGFLSESLFCWGLMGCGQDFHLVVWGSQPGLRSTFPFFLQFGLAGFHKH